jgi:hypothetical protein
MRAIEIQNSIDIAAPPEAVWPHLVDWESLGLWMAEASDFRVTSEHREGLGVEAEATIRIGGIKTRDTIRVTRWEPPEVLVIEHLGWVKGEGVLWCLRSPAGTHLWWLERLRPPLGPLGVTGIRLFKPLMRRIFRRDLSLLKQLVETSVKG